jgi:hypothetical protein
MPKNKTELNEGGIDMSTTPDQSGKNKAELAGFGGPDHAALSAMLDTGSINSKTELMGALVPWISQMSKDDIVKLFQASMAQFGQGNFPGTKETDKSGFNQATIKAKGSPLGMVKEDLLEVFATDDTLSEEFKEKAALIFESALNLKYSEVTTKLEEEYEEKLIEEVTKIREDLIDKVNDYLDFSVEKWVKDNSLVIDTSLRNEITEEFIQKLKTLFVESYIEIPEEKRDLLKEKEEELVVAKEELANIIKDVSDLKEEINVFKAEKIKAEITKTLTATQIEKFNTLSESIDFTTEEEFSKKLNTIKEAHFAVISENKNIITNTNIDGISLLEETTQNEPLRNVNPDVARYLPKKRI